MHPHTVIVIIYFFVIFFSTPAMNNLFPPQDAFDFSDDSSPGGAEGQKGSKVGDKSKDPVAGFKKIFSGPKKVRQGCQVLLCFTTQ